MKKLTKALVLTCSCATILGASSLAFAGLKKPIGLSVTLEKNTKSPKSPQGRKSLKSPQIREAASPETEAERTRKTPLDVNVTSPGGTGTHGASTNIERTKDGTLRHGHPSTWEKQNPDQHLLTTPMTGKDLQDQIRKQK